MPNDERKQYLKEYQKQYKKSHKQISVSFTLHQYKDFERQARSENTKVSSLVRNMALAYFQKQSLTPPAIADDLKELKFLIRNIANNVNQMAHHSNTIHQLVDENDFLGEIKKLEQLVNDYTNSSLTPPS